ncbi:HNH endonuclease [Leisingera aquimarina]|uniref:HNH endonuclease n=1 Tax=Leisingera aquimarina TaxID=476529 RepID=UPI000481AFA5|nr:HNH endonuclease [Leisingera aquimarina]
MPEILDTIEGLSNVHVAALRWFEERRGERVSWAEMKELADEKDMRLSTAAKGIYKPSYSDYALSVRTVQDGPYPDREVQYRPDGSWVCQYFQENPDPSLRDNYYTNKGLMLCMEHEVPVGFLIKRKSKPGVEYDVLGLGFVTSWDEGYFTIEGLSKNGEYKADRPEKDAAKCRSSLLSDPDLEEIIDATEDRREFQFRSVATRRGQAGFRNGLLTTYDSKCCLSGCDVPAALEAAHIAPYMGDHSNKLSNGLLLRSDLHTLFDLGLLSFDENYCALLSPELLASHQYAELKGRRINLPRSTGDQPDSAALLDHRSWAGFA